MSVTSVAAQTIGSRRWLATLARASPSMRREIMVVLVFCSVNIALPSVARKTSVSPRSVYNGF
jgi:hypothetical protein